MTIDLAVVVVVLIFTVLGVYQGLVPQLFRIGALILIWLLVNLLGAVFSVFLAPFGLPGLTKFYLGVLIGAVVVYGGLSFLGRYLSDRFINTRTSRMELHSKLGGYLGFIKGLLVVILVLFVLGALPEGYLEKKPKLHAQAQGSWAVFVVNLINPFPELTLFDDLSAYQKLLKDPQAVERLKEQSAFQKLREHPTVREALADPEVSRKLEELDYRSLLAEPKVARLLGDAEVRGLLLQLNPREALTASPPPAPGEGEPEAEPPSMLEPHVPEPTESEGEVLPQRELEDSQTRPGEGKIPVLPSGSPSEKGDNSTEEEKAIE